MTPTGLRALALKANMLTALTALLPSDADIVQLDLPTEAPPNSQPRRVYILDIPNETPSPVYVGGTQIRKSEFLAPVMLETISFTGNQLDGQSTVLALMQDLVTAVEGICFGDPSWGRAVQQSGFALSGEMTGPIAAQAGGWMSRVTLELHAMRQGV